MENYFIPTDLKVMGVVVKNFPDGIGEAFHAIVNRIPGEFSRPYYGIAELIKGKMIYKAAALEKEEGKDTLYQKECIWQKRSAIGEARRNALKTCLVKCTRMNGQTIPSRV